MLSVCLSCPDVSLRTDACARCVRPTGSVLLPCVGTYLPTCVAYLGGVRECARVRCVDALGWRDWVGVTEHAS